MQLQQYTGSKASLEINLSDTKLSKDISEFYVSYQTMNEQEVKKKQENDFKKQCYSLMLYQVQKDYNNAYQEYLNLIKETDVIRYRYGLITEIALDGDDANILNNKRVINENKHLYEAVRSSIKKDTGITKEIKLLLPLEYNKKEYNIEATTQKFINSSSSYHQIQNYIRNYQNHHDNAHISSYNSYQQTELQIEYYKLQKNELEDNIKGQVNWILQKAFTRRKQQK